MKERQICKIFTDQNITSYGTHDYKLHRIGGPALIENGMEKYYVEDKEYSKIQYNVISMSYKMKWMTKYSCKYSFYEVTIYFKNGEWHSENDQPCYSMPDFKIEYIETTPHEQFIEAKYRWYKDGVCHRENGPAIIWHNGSCSWFLNGILYETPKEMPHSLFMAYCKWNSTNQIIIDENASYIMGTWLIKET